VIIVSILIGFMLRLLHSLGRTFIGAVAIGVLLPSVIYLPRAQLLSPIAASLKTALSLLLMIPALWLIRLLLYDPAPPENFIATSIAEPH
jgi:hypothetical protein